MSNTLYELTAQMRQIEDSLEETGGELSPELEELWNETGESLVQKVDRGLLQDEPLFLHLHGTG